MAQNPIRRKTRPLSEAAEHAALIYLNYNASFKPVGNPCGVVLNGGIAFRMGKHRNQTVFHYIKQCVFHKAAVFAEIKLAQQIIAFTDGKKAFVFNDFRKVGAD